MGGIDDARSILSAMMGAVATVLALIFSVALLVLSMVATLFGPRLLYRFLQDWVTQVTIGLFMATFIYVCLCFLVTHQDAESHFIPQISLITSWVLVVGSFAFLVYYSHRIASSIQNPDMIARIAAELYPAASGERRARADGTTRDRGRREHHLLDHLRRFAPASRQGERQASRRSCMDSRSIRRTRTSPRSTERRGSHEGPLIGGTPSMIASDDNDPKTTTSREAHRRPVRQSLA